MVHSVVTLAFKVMTNGMTNEGTITNRYFKYFLNRNSCSMPTGPFTNVHRHMGAQKASKLGCVSSVFLCAWEGVSTRHMMTSQSPYRFLKGQIMMSIDDSVLYASHYC